MCMYVHGSRQSGVVPSSFRLVYRRREPVAPRTPSLVHAPPVNLYTVSSGMSTYTLPSAAVVVLGAPLPKSIEGLAGPCVVVGVRVFLVCVSDCVCVCVRVG